jgi:hypothetical protein
VSNIDNNKLLSLLYNQKDSIFFWFAVDDSIRNKLMITEKDTIFSSIYQTDSIISDSNKKTLLVVTENKTENKFLGINIYIMEFVFFCKEGDEWVLNERNFFGGYVSRSALPNIKFQQISTLKFVVVVEYGETNQGITTTNLDINMFGSQPDYYRLLTIEEAAMDNKGNCGKNSFPVSLCFEYNYQYNFISQKSGFYKFKIQTYGTKYSTSNKKIETINNVDIYSFKNAKYIKEIM